MGSPPRCSTVGRNEKTWWKRSLMPQCARRPVDRRGAGEIISGVMSRLAAKRRGRNANQDQVYGGRIPVRVRRLLGTGNRHPRRWRCTHHAWRQGTPRPIALFWIAAAAGFAMAGMAWNLARPVEGELGATTTAGGVGRRLVAWCRITLSLVVGLALPQAIHATRGDR